MKKSKISGMEYFINVCVSPFGSSYFLQFHSNLKVGLSKGTGWESKGDAEDKGSLDMHSFAVSLSVPWLGMMPWAWTAAGDVQSDLYYLNLGGGHWWHERFEREALLQSVSIATTTTIIIICETP